MPKTLTNLDLNKNEIQNVVVHKSGTAPSSPTEGQIYYNTTDKNFYRYNGTSWVTYQEIIDANGVLVGDGEGGITGLTTETATTLSIDNSPTASSNNLVTSGGVASALDGKQDTLVSGTNIKTINNTSLLGNGNIDIQAGDSLPSQSGQSGKFLTTDGTDASWANVPTEIPSQTGNNGKYLTTNGSAVSWGSISIPTSYASTPEMDGTASSGSSTSWARGDHVHPSDTNKQNKITASGILKGNGSGTISAAVAGTDYATPAQIPSVPSAYTSNPAMNGTASAGSSTNWAKGDHVHPTDTSRQETITANGLLKGNGSGSITAAVSGTDYQEPLPSQTGNGGKFLTTSGSDMSWEVPVSPWGTSITSNYTLSEADNGKTFLCITNDLTVTIPASSFTSGFEVEIINWGGHDITITPATSVTVNGSSNSVRLNTRYTSIKLKQVNRNSYTWFTDISERTVTDTVTLSSTWTGSGPYTQTVTLSNYTPTSSSKVDLQPDATVFNQLLTNGVQMLYISNTNGTLTAYAVGGKTTASLTIQCTITEV